MAANCSRSIASVGKRVIGHRISNSSPAIAPTPTRCWRGLVHTSAYEKNIEAGTTGEDDGIFQQATQQLKSPREEDSKYHYWEPHPQTGVFGPASAASSGANCTTTTTTTTTTTITDAPEEKAWFRPTSLEDLEKPHPLP